MGRSRLGPETLRPLKTIFDEGALGLRSDAELLDRCARGQRDEAAFTALVERHRPMVLRACRGVLGDPHVAEDAAQVTFLVLARKAGAIRPGETIAPWLYGVAVRVSAKITPIPCVPSSSLMTSGAPPATSIRPSMSFVECAQPVTGKPMPSRASSCRQRSLSREREIPCDSFVGKTPIISNCRTTAVP